MRRFLTAVLAVLLVAVVALTAFMWPRDDVPDAPDAVVVLGGGGGERAELGLELADRYDAHLVLSSSARFYASARGTGCDDVGVTCFEPAPPTTIGEARNLADMATDQGWDHITVVTSRFHTTRSRVVFRQCMGSDAVTVVGATGPTTRSFVPARDLREAIGILAAWTVERAC